MVNYYHQHGKLHYGKMAWYVVRLALKWSFLCVNFFPILQYVF